MSENVEPVLKREYCITRCGYRLNDPFEENITSPMTRQFRQGLDQAVEEFVSQIDFLDTGAVQLWEKNANNKTWFEMGSLYL